jgi:hypothetical protein
MINYWSSKLKLGAVFLTLALYVYCLLAIKTVYMKNKRLDHIMAMVSWLVGVGIHILLILQAILN